MPLSRHPLRRALRHLFLAVPAVRRAFPAAVQQAIAEAVRRAEREHPGEVRVVIEAGLDLRELLAGLSPRQRAMDLFASLRVWDTEHNTGVLIYVLLADHAVEIVADRGLGSARVDPAEWQAVCAAMVAAFRNGDYAGGVTAGIERVGAVLARHAPATGAGNELPDAPLILR